MLAVHPKTAPALLPPNFVWRSYSGGRVLRRFRGLADSGDDHFPEDWLASTVFARNGANSQGADEGLSRFGGTPGSEKIAEALQRDPPFWFGPAQAARTQTGVLWKLLDSSVRLQFQAHPDARFARTHLRSNAGKTECWYILATRGEACVYLGFQRAPERHEWARIIREQRLEQMLGCFDRIVVRPGDCFVVPAGTPHAIGGGVFMVELMEPTDWVVRCERVNAGVTLPDEACFMGLDLETCLDVFDYRAYSLAEVDTRFRQRPRMVRQTDAFSEEEIISSPWHKFFRLHRVQGTGTGSWIGGELMLLIMLDGAGTLKAPPQSRSQLSEETVTVHAGQTWLLPGAAGSWEWQPASTRWELLLAKLPLRPEEPSAPL